MVRARLDDPRRIEAARRLLAQARRETLERLAALSARLLNAAHAQIALVADVPVLVTPGSPVTDALLLEAFAEPVARPTFLSAPIDVAGDRVGLLTVQAAEPREWTHHDTETLRELAGTVAAELERGALAAELESSIVRLDLGFAAAGVGSFDWNLVTDALHWDDRLMELFGYEPETYVPHIDSFSVRLHPDDRAKTEAAISRAVESRGDYEADYRVVHPDGTVRWVAARGRVLADPDGRPVRMLGAAYDITDVRSGAERLGRVLETMSTAFFTIDREWRFTYANAAAERILGRSDLVGQVIWEVYDDLDGTESDVHFRGAMATGEPRSFEQFYAPLDTHFDVRVTPSDDGISVYFHDITSRVRAEQEREAALEQTGAATGRLQILSAAGARLAGSLDVDELLGILGDVVLNGFGEGLVVALDDNGAFRIVQAVHQDDEHSRGLAALAGEELVVDRFGTRTGVLGELVDAPAGLEQAPAMALPLISRGRTLGAAVVIGAAESALDRRVLVELAARAGVALDNAELFGSERRLALTLQRSLLPTALPQLPGIELAARYLPGVGGQDVGGDFYLGHPLDDGRLLLMIGDVMGHGPQAAARMGQLRAVLTAYAYDGDPPDRVLAHISTRATALLDLPLATVMVGIYDPIPRRLTFALAGHLPPLIAPLDAAPVFVDAAPGPPLGAGVTAYERHLFDIPPGATVVFYTDGLIEDRTRSIDVGLERLRDALREVKLPPEAVCDHVLHAVGRAEGGEDDIALLVMNHRAVLEPGEA
ncbi:SpoIIE family protein phosphatase [Solirubrobacter soli]|uniref:SpoIIE family protein phosphatase n=1 Tax=Solirubrobacter soli TaxID=363832 RepID=UPI00040ACBBD|nr:SpoIIE family protein phosphatase [Solirubrobacter soli]